MLSDTSSTSTLLFVQLNYQHLGTFIHTKVTTRKLNSSFTILGYDSSCEELLFEGSTSLLLGNEQFLIVIWTGTFAITFC